MLIVFQEAPLYIPLNFDLLNSLINNINVSGLLITIFSVNKETDLILSDFILPLKSEYVLKVLQLKIDEVKIIKNIKLFNFIKLSLFLLNDNWLYIVFLFSR